MYILTPKVLSFENMATFLIDQLFGQLSATAFVSVDGVLCGTGTLV